FIHLSAAGRMILHIEPFSAENDETGVWAADAVRAYIQYAVGQMGSVRLSEEEWIRTAYGLEKYKENSLEKEQKVYSRLKKDFILKGSVRRDAYMLKVSMQLSRASDPLKVREFSVSGSLGMMEELKQNLAEGLASAASSIQTREFADFRLTELEKKRLFRNSRISSLGFENLGKSLEKDISYEKSLEFIKKAMETDGNSAEVLIHAGILFSRRTDLLDESVSALEKAGKLLIENGERNTSAYLRVQYYTALSFYFKGEYNIALGQFLKAKAGAESLGQTDLMYLQLNDFIADTYMRKGQFKSAAACFLDIKRRYEMMNFTDSLLYANVLNNLALHYQDTFSETSLEYLKRAEEHYRKNGYEDKAGYPNTLSNIGNYFLEKKDTENALNYYRSASEFYERYGHTLTFGYANTLQNTAGIMMMKKDFDGSLIRFEKSREVYERILSASSWQYAMTVNRIADIQLIQGNRLKAEENSRLAREIYQKLGLMESHLYGYALETAGDIRKVNGDLKISADFYDKAYSVYQKNRKTDEARSVFMKYKAAKGDI
ncbi:MAG TPA: tetratricopeptide repeat protein, partial [Leptospiraceae bacterium]|nr:tetratricopeptide repeat protein [Leptospiraceae bacterium]